MSTRILPRRSGGATALKEYLDETWAGHAVWVAGVTSILGFDDVIDHQLASNEAMAWYQAGSDQVCLVDNLVTAYENTTSDRLPVLTRYVATK